MSEQTVVVKRGIMEWVFIMERFHEARNSCELLNTDGYGIFGKAHQSRNQNQGMLSYGSLLLLIQLWQLLLTAEVCPTQVVSQHWVSAYRIQFEPATSFRSAFHRNEERPTLHLPILGLH